MLRWFICGLRFVVGCGLHAVTVVLHTTPLAVNLSAGRCAM
jgi:hypothetical protein